MFVKCIGPAGGVREGTWAWRDNTSKRSDVTIEGALKTGYLPKLNHGARELFRRGRRWENFDIEFFDRRSTGIGAIKIIQHSRKLINVAGVGFIENKRAGWHIEKTHAAQSCAHAKILILQHDNHRGKFLYALDSTGTSGQKLTEPEIRIGRV